MKPMCTKTPPQCGWINFFFLSSRRSAREASRLWGLRLSCHRVGSSGWEGRLTSLHATQVLESRCCFSLIYPSWFSSSCCSSSVRATLAQCVPWMPSTWRTPTSWWARQLPTPQSDSGSAPESPEMVWVEFVFKFIAKVVNTCPLVAIW